MLPIMPERARYAGENARGLSKDKSWRNGWPKLGAERTRSDARLCEAAVGVQIFELWTILCALGEGGAPICANIYILPIVLPVDFPRLCRKRMTEKRCRRQSFIARKFAHSG